ncbi:hypothetical protein [Rubrivirga sp. IMCC43871]|uniref:hypothetical protein n=1 Tax=Rubrivirga sp. IMCC43871 TaxID=3391575 RepID=UPI00398FE67D
MDLATPGAADERQAEPRRLHHITRIDIDPSPEHPRRHATHGWQVRARRDGQRLSKFFADAKHEGREDALEAAIAYRDRLLASLPEEPQKPRKAWSNTGVVGLSVREKTTTGVAKLYVQLNWVDAAGKRKAGSFSVEKWGIRRALWNGCLKLYRERQTAGYPVEEPHVMFARAQTPFQDLVDAEIAAEQAGASLATPVAETPVADVATPVERARRERSERNRETFESKEAAMARHDDKMRKLEDVLFG